MAKDGIEKGVIFIGPEGSGKTTQGVKLSNEIGIPYITTGGITRELASSDSGPLGDECRDMYARHIYLSAPSLLAILSNRLSQDDVAHGFVLDGGLRTYDETLGFSQMLKEANFTLPMLVIYLQIPQEESFRRLVSGPNARQRVDDTQEGVAARLAMFNLQLEERLEKIKGQQDWRLEEIDGTSSVDEVYDQVYRISVC